MFFWSRSLRRHRRPLLSACCSLPEAPAATSTPRSPSPRRSRTLPPTPRCSSSDRTLASRAPPCPPLALPSPPSLGPALPCRFSPPPTSFSPLTSSARSPRAWGSFYDSGPPSLSAPAATSPRLCASPPPCAASRSLFRSRTATRDS